MSGSGATKWAMIFLRVALGAVFFYAGFVKMREPPWLFEASVASFRMAPDSWVRPLASSLPFLEALAGFWLALGWRSRGPAFAVLLLSAVFLLALGQGWLRGLDISCGCFGASESELPLWQKFARDLILLGWAGFVYWQAFQRRPAEIFWRHK